jgi:hypothetical protein
MSPQLDGESVTASINGHKSGRRCAEWSPLHQMVTVAPGQVDDREGKTAKISPIE